MSALRYTGVTYTCDMLEWFTVNVLCTCGTAQAVRDRVIRSRGWLAGVPFLMHGHVHVHKRTKCFDITL